MKIVRHGRLTGKGRRVYHRERERSRWDHQAIDEFLAGPGPRTGDDRVVPVVRGRTWLTDFRSAPAISSPRLARESGMTPARPDADRVVHDARPDPEAETGRAPHGDPDRTTAGLPDPIRPTLHRRHRPDVPGTPIFWNVLAGCATGAAAALVILVLVRAIIG